ncbi:hypothetical protein K227x_58120 [Rubripirellula lacrimiformis]|uniref:Ice-binding protein C-terminal domain-containing protein n=1 Tax=Rubripirellula lacrimiformis TaxID=1930273 RepID=A0A517NJT0_9BACT|nr:PEP-CTERM sorting domain-containing protein [Rubripirellula lacrimiformis]QDT07385.1 hypothetical protein K227x_58120 [Rubripirellula lacrimiformis]
MKRLFQLLLTVPAIMASLASPSDADLVTVINPSFEDIRGENFTNGFTFGPLGGWDLYDPNGITNGGAGNTYFVGTLTPAANSPFFPSGAADGQRVGIAFNFAGSGGQGEYGMQQTLAATLQPNTAYSLDVEIGNIASGTSFDLSGFPGYRVDLLAGGVVVAQDNNSLNGLIAEGDFETSNISFATTASHAQLGQALQIRLVNLNQIDAAFPTADLEVDFDFIRLRATAVPEPSSLAALLIGIGMVARRRWRRGDRCSAP